MSYTLALCQNKESLHLKRTRISALALVAFLFAFFAHSQHITLQSSATEACHICQQGFDSPVQQVKLSFVVQVAYFINEHFWPDSSPTSPYNGLASLRAPPLF